MDFLPLSIFVEFWNLDSKIDLKEIIMMKRKKLDIQIFLAIYVSYLDFNYVKIMKSQ